MRLLGVPEESKPERVRWARRHTPGAKAPLAWRDERAKAKALAYLDARTRFRSGFVLVACAEGASECGEGFDDLGGPLGELVVAEGAVVGLEDRAQEEGVDAGVFCVTPDLDGFEALQLGDGEGVDGRGDGVPLGGVGEDEREVALDGLETGEVVGGDFFEGEFVEPGEIELGEVDGLAELVGVALGVGEFAEVGDGLVVYEGRGGAAGLEPVGGFCGEG